MKFNNIFHTNHITDVKSIMNELMALENDKLNYENIDEILSKICMARILKKEDRDITGIKKCDRGTDFSYIYNSIYKAEAIENEIELLRYDGSPVD